MIRIAGSLLAIWAAGVVTPVARAQVSEEAQALIDRTRETRATYSLVTRNRIANADGSVTDEWAAEFHDGIHHRVETPRDRIVADCAAMTGTYAEIRTGKIIEGPEVARAACGVQANSEILSARLDSVRQTRFGPVTRLIVVDADNARSYDVADNGALLGATISERNGSWRLLNWAVKFAAEVPAGIFSKESLTKSAVPEELRKVRHKPPPSDN